MIQVYWRAALKANIIEGIIYTYPQNMRRCASLYELLIDENIDEVPLPCNMREFAFSRDGVNIIPADKIGSYDVAAIIRYLGRYK
jgi:hypothetical protein